MEIMKLRVADICESAMNPRKTFDKDAISELAKNIAEQGLLQPITVRTPHAEGFDTFEKLDKDGTAHEIKYEGVCGARRFRAVVKLGWEEVPAIVRDMTDAEAFDAMITENLQRKDVDPLDESMAFCELMSKGVTVKELAVRFGKSERYIQDRTKLRSLIPELRRELTKGHIPLVGAIYLCRLDEQKQKDFYSKEIEGELDDDETYPYSDIKQWVSSSFNRLENQRWFAQGEDEPWNNQKEVPKCKTCQCNTSNHGCLFYEMKKDAECTNEACFERKKIAYRKWELKSMADKLWKKGTDYTPDKTVLLEEKKESWRTDEQNGAILSRNEELKSVIPDAVVMHTDDFSARCYYKEDDERLQKFLAEGKVFRATYLFTEWREYENMYFYKKGVDYTNVNMTDEERMKMELDAVTKKNYEKIDGELLKMVKEIPDEKFGSDNELLQYMMRRIVLESCDYDYKRQLIADHSEDDIDQLLSDDEKFKEILANASKEFIGRYSYLYNLGGHLRNKVAERLIPDEYRDLVCKYDEKLEKEIEKVRMKYQQ